MLLFSSYILCYGLPAVNGPNKLILNAGVVPLSSGIWARRYASGSDDVSIVIPVAEVTVVAVTASLVAMNQF